MKEWKESLVQQMVDDCVDCKIVSLKDVAGRSGIRHIDRQDAQDIVFAAIKRVPNYRPVRLMDNQLDSFANSICLVQNDVAFEDDF